MAYFGSSFSADSPVVTISPQTAHQALSLGMPTYQNEAALNHSMPFASQNHFPRPPPQTRPSGAGRKRSRDEAEVNLSDDLPEPTPIEPIKESEDDWIYGEGMILIKPGSGYVADASSQSGTWVEEQAAAVEEARKAEAAAALQRQIDQRPSLRSHKSQRLEQSAAASPGYELNCPSPPKQDILAEPVVDDFTIHLGIGWRRLSDDEHIQAAARGWAKFIENHFPVSNVSIRLESKGLQSYLVETREGYFLFSENLREGRLVSTTVEGVLRNLKSNPPLFDSPNTFMVAAESPQPAASQSLFNTSSNIAMGGDIEMEVC